MTTTWVQRRATESRKNRIAQMQGQRTSQRRAPLTVAPSPVHWCLRTILRGFECLSVVKCDRRKVSFFLLQMTQSQIKGDTVVQWSVVGFVLRLSVKMSVKTALSATSGQIWLKFNRITGAGLVYFSVWELLHDQFGKYIKNDKPVHIHGY